MQNITRVWPFGLDRDVFNLLRVNMYSTSICTLALKSRNVLVESLK